MDSKPAVPTYLLFITPTFTVRFTGIISRWQKACLWLAGIDVRELDVVITKHGIKDYIKR